MMRPSWLRVAMTSTLLAACADDGTPTSATAGGTGGTTSATTPTSTTTPTSATSTTDVPTTSTTAPATATDPGSSSGATTSSATSDVTTTDATTGSTGTTQSSTTGSSTTDASSSSSTTGDPPPPACVAFAPTQPAGDCAQIGVSIEPPYDQFYTCYDLGELPGVPKEWGGVIVEKDDPYVLLAGGAANTAAGKLYAVSIARDEDCHILGYQAKPTTTFSAAEYNDGGLTYHPVSEVLFLSRWPANELGQLKPGSMVTDKVTALAPLGVVSSPGGFTFVPAGFAGEHTLKAVSWPGGEWYTLDLAPDGAGTYDVTKATMNTKIVGGPEAFVYISDENPEFAVDSLLVAEWSAGNIAAYEADADGNPVIVTRKDFIKGLSGAESAYVDPLSGDFLFATFAGVERLVAIRGFKPQPQ